MYKEFTASEWRKYLNLPDDYSINGFLIYGTWNSQKQLTILEKSLKNLDVQFKLNDLPDFLARIMEIIIDGNRYWFVVSYGGALLSEYLHLACMFGSKKNILIGTCGGLYDQLHSGDFIVPTFSYGNESTTRLYQRQVTDNRHFSDKHLGESLIKNIDSKYKAHHGPTITCQAMMGETIQDIKEWSKDGYYGVEMEAATVFAVSKHFKVPASSLLIIGDNLVKGETVGGEGYESLRAFRDGARLEQYRVALSELFS